MPNEETTVDVECSCSVLHVFRGLLASNTSDRTEQRKMQAKNNFILHITKYRWKCGVIEGRPSVNKARRALGVKTEGPA
jgi:hypothetical protein